MATSDSKKSKSAARKGKPSAGTPESTLVDAAAQSIGISGRNSAFQFDDPDIKKYLASGENSGALEDYFGEGTYRELRELAREASARSVRGGPRVLIIPGIMGSKIGRKGKLKRHSYLNRLRRGIAVDDDGQPIKLENVRGLIFDIQAWEN